MNLNQVTISVTNIERSVSFYEGLGLRLIVKALPDYARFECTEGDSTFSLHRVEELSGPSGISIYFEIADLDQAVNNLVKEGVVFEEMPNDKPWLWREARLKDPDNNQLVLYFAGRHRKDPPWKYKL